MSDNDKFGAIDFDAIFGEIVSTSSEQDAGITDYEKKISIAEDDLRNRIIGQAPENIGEIVAQYEDSLNSQWEHHDSIATLSGRVNVVSSALLSRVPSDWGEPDNIDSEGNVLSFEDHEELPYYIEGKKIRSHGVSIELQYNTEDDERGKGNELVSDVKIAYVYSLVEDEMEEELFTAYPGELTLHIYDTPTFLESEHRLERQWPNEKAFIDMVLKPTAIEGIQMRLSLVGRRLQNLLTESSDFRTNAERYVNGRLKFNQNFPYLITVKNSLSYFEADQDGAKLSDGDWIHLSLLQPTTFEMYEPKVEFTSYNDDGIRTHIRGYTYSEDSIDEPEEFSVGTENVELFRSTLARRSLAARALLGAHISTTNEDDFRRYQWARVLHANEPAIIAMPHRLKKPSNYVDGKPVRIAEMEKALDQFDSIARLVRKARRVTYTTVDEALAASDKLIEESIKPLIHGFFDGKTEMEFFGSGVCEPKVLIGALPNEDGDEIGVMLRVDLNDRFTRLDVGDSLVGIPSGIVPFIQPEFEGDQEKGYTVNPSIIIQLQITEVPLSVWQGIEMAEMVLYKKAVIPLDGTVTMKNKNVDWYHQKRQALLDVSKQYGHHPIVKKIQRLNKALTTDNDGTYLALMKPEIIKSVGRGIESITLEGANARAAMDAIDSLLVGRRVLVTGDIYRRNDDGSFIEEEMGAPGDPTHVEIVDIRNDIMGTRPVMVADFNKSIRLYIPIDGITGLRF